MKLKLAALALVAGLGLVASGCSSSNNPYIPPAQTRAAPKGVYTMTNNAAGNKIAFYRRAADGSLTYVSSYATGGNGSGGHALTSQGSLVFNPDLNLFFCVNAGDGTSDGSVSMLRLNEDGSLTLLSHIDSGGVNPVSLTQSSQTLVVLNAGDGTSANPANVTAFSINGGTLTAIPNTTAPLGNNASPFPFQVSFTPNGDTLVVTEEATDSIVVLGTDQNGQGYEQFNESGNQPDGFAFGPNGNLLVSEFDGATPDYAASSYSIDTNTGVLSTISGSVDSGQTALTQCWLTVAGGYAYVDSGSAITRYAIGSNGGLTQEHTTIADTGFLTDEDATDGNDFLYVLGNANLMTRSTNRAATGPTIEYFPINNDGSLGTMQTYSTNVPANATGLVAR